MQVLSVVTSIAQVLSPLLYAAFIVVIYFQLRAARESVREVRQEFLAGGRPVVTVHDEFDHATRALSLAVENVGQGPAKRISFEFAQSIKSSDGVVISGLPLFAIGLTSLSPGARITCFWDDLDDQLAFLESNGLAGQDFTVLVRYTDLPGSEYSNGWDIQPAIYQGLRPPPDPGRHRDDQAGEAREVSGDDLRDTATTTAAPGSAPVRDGTPTTDGTPTDGTSGRTDGAGSASAAASSGAANDTADRT